MGNDQYSRGDDYVSIKDLSYKLNIKLSDSSKTLGSEYKRAMKDQVDILDRYISNKNRGVRKGEYRP